MRYRAEDKGTRGQGDKGRALIRFLVLLCLLSPLAAQRALGVMDDKTFFGTLDLSREDLASVREAVERQDLAGAKRAFVEHLKQRNLPVWSFNWRTRTLTNMKISDADRRNAERFARNDLVSVDVWYDFKDKLDWTSNHTENHYDEWTWQLSRHAFWETMGRAYWATGDEKYAKAFVKQMNDWIRSQPVPEDSGNKPGSTWRTIETGIRMFSSWPNAFFYFLSSPSFDDESIILMVKSFADHADHLMRFPTTGNWLAMESNGLYHVGVIFPEFRDATKWRETGMQRLYEELDKQVYPDGAQVELSPSYHNVSLNSFEMPLRLARMNHLPVPDDYVAKLQRMFDFDEFISMPSRKVPPMNDSGETDIRPWMVKAADYFPDRKDYLWLATDGAQGIPPAKVSCDFPYAGYYVMRSGWEPDARYLLFDAGPFGYGHQHEDKLTLVAAAYGKVHLIDVGNYPYDTSPWRKYAIDTFAHNTVLVDGLPQRRRGEKDRNNYIIKEPQPHTFFTTDGYDIASGTYDEGYGDEKKKLATHKREVIFVKREPREYWVVTDTLTPPEKDRSPHTYDAMFHLDAPDINLDARSLSVVTKNKPGESNFIIAAMVVPGLSVANQAGQEKPFVQGWAREGSYGMRKIPTPVYHLEAVGPAKMIFVLYPVRPDEKPPAITVTTAQPLRIRFGDRGVDRIEPGVDPALPLRISHDN